MGCSREGHKWYLRKLSPDHALYVCSICDSGLNVDHPRGSSGIGLSEVLLVAGGLAILGLSLTTWYVFGFLAAAIAGVVTWFGVMPWVQGRLLVRYQRGLINHLADNADRLGIDLNWRTLPECRNCGRRTPTERPSVNYCFRCHPHGEVAAYMEEVLGDREHRG